jgi:hypothetical protein
MKLSPYIEEIKARQKKRKDNEGFYKHSNKKIKKFSYSFSYGKNIYERKLELEMYMEKCGIYVDYIN